MKVSQLVFKTLREVPASAEIPSHIFLLRGGYIKQLAAGLYSILPLGKRVINKIESIIRQEMDRIGGQEVDLPLVQPAELWINSGRYAAIGDELLRFKDRGRHEMVLAMTHEEAVTDLLKSVISSYKQLPCMVYQLKLKFRDEPRSRGGLIRVREFVMKDAYSFHTSENDLDAYYQKVYDAYLRIFSRVGISAVVVQSDTGFIGGNTAHEFMLETKSGEDNLIISEDGSYGANQEIAVFDREPEKQEELPMEKVATPEQKTIEEVSEFLQVDKRKTIKALMYFQDPRLVLVLVRGDLNVGETKVKNYLKLTQLLPADDSVISRFGMVPGFASAVGLKESDDLIILVDQSVSQGSNFITGANQQGFHLKNVNFIRDFNSSHVGDFAQAESGHKCLHSQARLKAAKCIEIGNIFKLGTKFSQPMKADFLDEGGAGSPMVMGCYGIGVGRLMAAVVEKYHDDFGPVWPKEISPYQVHLLNIGAEKEVVQACSELYDTLVNNHFEVLYDDRDERPGVKFKDADLWGIPVRLGISKKTLADKTCEWKVRGSKDLEKIPIDSAAERVRAFYQG
jgi:prolyl-tRNA synthetase